MSRSRAKGRVAVTGVGRGRLRQAHPQNPTAPICGAAGSVWTRLACSRASRSLCSGPPPSPWLLPGACTVVCPWRRTSVGRWSPVHLSLVPADWGQRAVCRRPSGQVQCRSLPKLLVTVEVADKTTRPRRRITLLLRQN